jgi:cytochrome c oxidase assembly protein subunit 15
MGNVEWQQAFDRYQQIAQYKYLNTHFNLGDFKFIFFWEWFHRLWARLIVVVFLIPFAWFLVKKYFKSWMVSPLLILFLLGALQGAIGWIMVKSGLNDNDLYVSHIRLAVHFMAAMILISYALIFGLMLSTDRTARITDAGLYRGALIITGLVTIQLVFGAFMAGLKAAAAAPTWPDINGMIVPQEVFSTGNFLSNIIYNKIGVHFVHRTLAYLVALFILIWWYSGRSIRSSRAFTTVRNFALFFVITQVALGVFTVFSSPTIVAGKFGLFEWLAEIHQLTGMLLLLTMVASVYFLSKKRGYAA